MIVALVVETANVIVLALLPVERLKLKYKLTVYIPGLADTEATLMSVGLICVFKLLYAIPL